MHLPETETMAAMERTCAGCRARDDRDALVRFVLGPDGRLVADVRRRLPGRGVSVHPRRACIVDAATRGGFARSLRSEVRADVADLVAQLIAQYAKRIEGLLVAAHRSRSLVVGTEAVRSELRRAAPALILVAEDAAGRREEIERSAERLGEQCVVYGSKESLGRLFGRDEVGVLAIDDRGIASEVARAAACMKALSGGVRADCAEGLRNVREEG